MYNSLTEQLSGFDLWTTLYEELHCFHKSKAHKKYSFSCRNCGGSFSLVCDIVPAGCSWHCENCGCEKDGDTFVDLILATTQLRNLSSTKIIDTAVEVVLRHQRRTKKQTPVRIEGCYEINKTVVPVKPVKPSKAPVKKPRPARKPKGEGAYECK